MSLRSSALGLEGLNAAQDVLGSVDGADDLGPLLGVEADEEPGVLLLLEVDPDRVLLVQHQVGEAEQGLYLFQPLGVGLVAVAVWLRHDPSVTGNLPAACAGLLLLDEASDLEPVRTLQSYLRAGDARCSTDEVHGRALVL